MSNYSKFKDLGEKKIEVEENFNNSILNQRSHNHNDPPNNLNTKSNNSSAVYHINSIEDKINVINGSNLCIVYIWGDWCGPCKQVAPKYERLANKYLNHPHCVFVKENVNLNIPQLKGYIKNGHTMKQTLGIPKFEFFKNNAYHSEITGGDMEEIEGRILSLLD